MALYTKNDIAEMTGKPIKTVAAWCAPTKKTLIVTDGYIDTGILKNKVFINKKVEEFKNKDKPIEKKPPPEEKIDRRKKVYPEKSKEDIEQQNELYNLDLEIKKANLQKVKKDLQIKEIDIRKKNGELIEAGSVISIIEAHSDSLKKNLEDQLKVFMREFNKRYSVERENASRNVNRVTEIINKANQKAVESLIVNFEKIIE